MGSTLTEHSDDVGAPMLARDGVTIVRRIGGVTGDGIAFDGFEEFKPGDPGYGELLLTARESQISDADLGPVDSAALARVLHPVWILRTSPRIVDLVWCSVPRCAGRSPRGRRNS
jgi:hypothetical protein